jgi:hypothetical protein
MGAEDGGDALQPLRLLLLPPQPDWKDAKLLELYNDISFRPKEEPP